MTTTEYDAKALYTNEQRQGISQKIFDTLRQECLKYGVVIEDVLLRKCTLPSQLQDAINEKLKAEQNSQKMEFVLESARKEAERLKIEEQGIADFQRIVTQGITPDLLRWKGIEATENLAKSPNSKVIVIGGKDGLPLILNTGDDEKEAK